MINYDDIDFDFFTWPEVSSILEKCNIQVYHPDQCTWNTDQYQVLVDSWHDIEQCEERIINLGLIADIPDIIRDGDILEKVFDICFSDSYTSCSSCGKLIDISPSYYGDLPDYLYTDCGILCSDCYSDDDVIETYKNDAGRALNSRQLKKSLTELGWKLYDGDFESGFHPGQTDNPRKISRDFEEEHPDNDWLFCIDRAGQFDIHFSLWHKPRRNEE